MRGQIQPAALEVVSEHLGGFEGGRQLGGLRVMPAEDGIVDLRVVTSDVWTLTPSISAGREGGENSFGIGVKEQNLFGNGVLLHFKYREDVDRDTMTLDFANRHFRGTRDHLAFRIGNNSDGYDHRFYYARPFFALDSRRSHGMALAAGLKLVTDGLAALT